MRAIECGTDGRDSEGEQGGARDRGVTSRAERQRGSAPRVEEYCGTAETALQFRAGQ